MEISENTKVGTIVALVTANDVDSGPPLSYRLANGNIDDTFIIERHTGQITVAKPLDHEKIQEFMLTIEARDSVHVAIAKQKVVVLDENDNAPVFAQQFYQVDMRGG